MITTIGELVMVVGYATHIKKRTRRSVKLRSKTKCRMRKDCDSVALFSVLSLKDSFSSYNASKQVLEKSKLTETYRLTDKVISRGRCSP